MKQVLEDTKTEERAEPISDSDAAFLRQEIEDAVKRAERSFNASKAALTDTLEDGRIAAERLLKRGRAAAEDYLDEATYQVKHNPKAVVALAFGVGALVGVIFGLFAQTSGQKDSRADRSAGRG